MSRAIGWLALLSVAVFAKLGLVGPVHSYDDSSLLFPGERVLGSFVDDAGAVSIGVGSSNGSSLVEMVVWRGRESDRYVLEPPGGELDLIRNFWPLDEGRFALHGVRTIDDSEHGAEVYYVCRLTSGGRLAVEGTTDSSKWPEASLEISADGRIWGALILNQRGRYFAFGNVRSSKIRSKGELAFPTPVREDYVFASDAAAFEFIDPDVPVVLAPYGDNVYLLRFGEAGLHSEVVEQLKPVLSYAGFHVVWQEQDRVLWAYDGKEWTAWDLWDLGVSGFPDEPYIRQKEGWPHRQRGFVRVVRQSEEYRVEHLWRRPLFPDAEEVHVSDWQAEAIASDSSLAGRLSGYGSSRITVSPSGRYAVMIGVSLESDEREAASAEPARGEAAPQFYARRIELRPSVPAVGGSDERSEAAGDGL